MKIATQKNVKKGRNMSRMHDIKTKKGKRHSCVLRKNEVLNQKSGKNQPNKRTHLAIVPSKK